MYLGKEVVGETTNSLSYTLNTPQIVIISAQAFDGRKWSLNGSINLRPNFAPTRPLLTYSPQKLIYNVGDNVTFFADNSVDYDGDPIELRVENWG